MCECVCAASDSAYPLVGEKAAKAAGTLHHMIYFSDHHKKTFEADGSETNIVSAATGLCIVSLFMKVLTMIRLHTHANTVNPLASFMSPSKGVCSPRAALLLMGCSHGLAVKIFPLGMKLNSPRLIYCQEEG